MLEHAITVRVAKVFWCKRDRAKQSNKNHIAMMFCHRESGGFLPSNHPRLGRATARLRGHSDSSDRCRSQPSLTVVYYPTWIRKRSGRRQCKQGVIANGCQNSLAARLWWARERITTDVEAQSYGHRGCCCDASGVGKPMPQRCSRN